MSTGTVRLLISCPDARGIIATVAGFIAQHGGNILDADQHTDPQHGEFFMRVEVEQAGFRLARQTFEQSWRPVAEQYRMRWQAYWGDVKRMALFVSKMGHCLSDILWRWKTGELAVEIPLVVSNHDHLAADVAAFGIPFHYVPVSPETKASAESRALELIQSERVDVVVLARYMQVLSPGFVAQFPQRIINIHHSFLPAFAGPRPYQLAYERGVKIIGATSHYVTEVLDDGPIIAQETLAVDHRDGVDDLARKGRDLERVVLARAVHLHVEDKILTSRNKTVVFG